MANHSPDEHMDPVTRVVKMAQEGDVSKITTAMLEEAYQYRLKQEQENAQESASKENDES